MYKGLTKMFRGLSWNNIKQWPKWAMFYVLGVLSICVAGAISAAIDPPIIGDQKEMVKRWDMRELEGKALLIEFTDVNDIYWTLVVNRDQQNEKVERISLMNGRNGVDEEMISVFEYFGLGTGSLYHYETGKGYDCPLVNYGWYGHEPNTVSCIWQDLNYDSLFDEKYISRGDEFLYEILIEDNWVQGKKIGERNKQVKTDNGVFEFDINIGQWKKIAAIK